MKTEELACAARRLLEERLGRLRGSMEGLGAWFRENVARLIGQHVGAAARDAVAAALGRPVRSDRDDYDEEDAGYGGRGPYELPNSDENEGGDDFWGRHEDRRPRHERPAEPRSDRRRWDALLACVAQVAAWWLRQGLPRASLVRVLTLGAAAGVAALLLGPLAGALLATAGTVLLAAGPPSVEPSKTSH